jgi:serine/threonine protein kinase
MAPEQLEGKEADGRTDIFAFGAVLYEMATAKKAFGGSSQASLISGIMQNDPPPISGVSPMVPAAFDRVVRTCLAKDPEDRWQSARDVAVQLKWIVEGSQAGVPAPVIARRKTRERLAWSGRRDRHTARGGFGGGLPAAGRRVRCPRFGRCSPCPRQ